jgi:hypothetical protein
MDGWKMSKKAKPAHKKPAKKAAAKPKKKESWWARHISER